VPAAAKLARHPLHWERNRHDFTQAEEIYLAEGAELAKSAHARTRISYHGTMRCAARSARRNRMTKPALATQ